MYVSFKDMIESKILENLDEGRKFKIGKNGKTRMITKPEWDTYQQMGWEKIEEDLEEKVKTTHKDPIVLVYRNGKSNAVGQMNLSTACRMHDVKCDASKLHKAGVDKKVKVGNGYSFALSPSHEKMLDEGIESPRQAQTAFKKIMATAKKMKLSGRITAVDLKKGTEHIASKFSTKDGDEPDDEFLDAIEDALNESLGEAKGDIKTFKTLEDWLMAVLSIKGATVSKMGNTLRANGLGRGGSATFELKKGRGSLLESAEDLENLEEAGKLHKMILDVIKKMSPKEQKLAIAGLPKDMQQQALDYIKEEKEECPKCEGEGCDHCDDTGYHVTEGLDKVNKKALDKDFDDRKDKDIDNDGDVDDSDEYLHKRRGAIKKAISKNESSMTASKLKEMVKNKRNS